ncbi:MAG TPA: PaaI family thioesterase [Streptosporangiaceae bacterium]|nr:PaaI family thioesterase [Streptosporangiaceae bacterium]
MPDINWAGAPASRLMVALGLVIDEPAAPAGPGAAGTDAAGRDGCTLVRGHIDAGPDHHTPAGIVHGALYTGAVETAASVGASLAVRSSGQFAVGVDNVTDFLRPVRQGRLDVEARAVSQGRTLQLWEVDIADADGRLVAKGRVRLANRPLPG